ncbi:hypothetical protein TFLX_03137 [Thermoflexales bacterium]|nr:hypothetical protein TFLX_03137 [Thermoflexales bacterium]
MNTPRYRIATALMLTVLFLSAALFHMATTRPVSADAAPPPPAGSIRGSFMSYTNLNSHLYTTTETAYTAYVDPNYWYQADVFLTIDVSGTASVTVTPQFSADASAWADANYVYLSNSSTTTIITGTDGMTGTTTSATSIVNTTPYLVLSADGTDYMQFALAGRYLRYKIDAGSFVTTTDRVTVTVKTVVKNSAGQ